MKMYFRGRNYRSLDPKGRLMLPPEFRQCIVDHSRTASDGDSLADTAAMPFFEPAQPGKEVKFTLTTYDGCLVAYLWPDWQDLEAKFVRITNPSPQIRDFRRMVLGGAEVQILDGQGRIRLSQDHREYAQLGKEALLIGLINRFEIWNPELFKLKMAKQSLNDVSEELAASGIDFAF